MHKPIQMPSRGEPLRASWAADVVNTLNSLGAGGRAGMMTRDGMAVPVPGNGRAAALIDAMPFALSYGQVESEDDDTGGEETGGEETHLLLTNCRYRHGGEFKELDDVDIHDLRGLIALKIYHGTSGDFSTGEAEVVAYEEDDITTAFQAADFTNGAYQLIPLYFVDEDGEITHDLRGLPACDHYPIPWRWNGTSFDNAYVQIGRSISEVTSGNANITAAGSYYVHVSHPVGSAPSAELVSTVGTNDDDNTYLHVATLDETSAGDVRQSFGIYAYPIVYLYD